MARANCIIVGTDKAPIYIDPNDPRFAEVAECGIRHGPAYTFDEKQDGSALDDQGNKYFIDGCDLVKWHMDSGKFSHLHLPGIEKSVLQTVRFGPRPKPLATIEAQNEQMIAFKVQPADGVFVTMSMGCKTFDDYAVDAKLDVARVVAELTKYAEIAEMYAADGGLRRVCEPPIECGNVAWIFKDRLVTWSDYFQEDVNGRFTTVGFEITLSAARMAAILREAIMLIS